MRRSGPILVISALFACSRGEPESAAPLAEADPPEPTPAAEPEPSAPLRLAGAIELPNGSLAFAVVIERDASGAPKGTLSIPAQGVADAELSIVNMTEDAVEFTLGPVGATWRVAALTSANPTCTFEQHGAKLPCTARATAADGEPEDVGPTRPQTPKPPFPYEVQALEYDNPAGNVHIAGTLTLPAGAGPHPVALLISGSGPQDRDETILGHKPFWVLADHLARHGIATLRVDDRGVGGTSAGPPGATSADFASDVKAGVAVLREHPRIDPKRVGLIGHSEGGLIAPMVAAEDRRIAFVVLLAGPGVPGAELMPEQSAAVARALGGTAEQVEAAKRSSARTMALLRTKASADEILQQLAKEHGIADDNPELRSQVAMVTSPWFRAFASTDPRPLLRKVRAPVLALNGSLDTQVLADQNLPEIERALRKGGNRRVRVVRLDGLNHLFQPAKTGAPTEYETIETTIDPAVLELVADFIAEAP